MNEPIDEKELPPPLTLEDVATRWLQQTPEAKPVKETTRREVIESLRVPTPRMLEVANHVFADRIWRQMIDQALKDMD